MEVVNWECLGYNRDGVGYKCKKCGEVFSDYATIATNGKCPKCGSSYSEKVATGLLSGKEKS